MTCENDTHTHTSLVYKLQCGEYGDFEVYLFNLLRNVKKKRTKLMIVFCVLSKIFIFVCFVVFTVWPCSFEMFSWWIDEF